MKALTANEAKTQFGELLFKVQRAPVEISKNGKPVAVVMSIEDYKEVDALKMQVLKAQVQRGKADFDAGNTINGEAFFDELEEGLSE